VAECPPPVHVVGLLGGRPVGQAAHDALQTAGLVAGGRDQLAAVAALVAPGARTVLVGAGLAALDDVAAHRGPSCVLASGDPGFFGIVRSLSARLGDERLVVHPAPSSVALAFARLALPWDDAVVASCHTGDAVRAAAAVAHAPVAAVLCGPEAPPEAVGAALLAHGAHHRLVAVGTRLGEQGEQVQRCSDLSELAAGRFDHRSVVVLAHPSPAATRPAALPGGRPLSAFAHRASMITKPEVRSVVLGKLDLPERGVLWDVGAGSGSVAIEAALAAPGLRVIAVERDAGDAERTMANASALGAVVEVVVGAAPAALAGLPAPDRVFVGGGGLAVLDAGASALRGGGRIVATFAAVDRAAEAYRRLGSLVQVSVDRADVLPDGGIRFAADNPVFVAWGDQLAAQSPDEQDGPLAIGVGCSSSATAGEVSAVVAGALAQVARPPGPGPASMAGNGNRPTGSEAAAGDGGAPAPAPAPAAGAAPPVVATIDGRVDHAAVIAAAEGRRLLAFPASLLGSVTVPNPSRPVEAAVGTPSVAEAAALLAAGPGSRLVVTKQRGPTATAAVAQGASNGRASNGRASGRLQIVGLGPGDPRHRTPAAVTAVRGADAVVGYGPYVDVVERLLRPEQLVVRSTMGSEADRAIAALSLARSGWRAALVSSGDPGVFAMASVALELAPEVLGVGWSDVTIEVVPGVTAASAAGAAAGAPLAGPHAALTLSDILLPWPTIERQLRCAAEAGLALALYNPRSSGRPDNLARARVVLLEALEPSTPVAVVTDASGPHEQVHRTSLGELDPTVAGMRSLVLVGTAETVDAGGRMISRRHHPRPDTGARRDAT